LGKWEWGIGIYDFFWGIWELENRGINWENEQGSGKVREWENGLGSQIINANPRHCFL